MAFENSRPIKRSSSAIDLHGPIAKKRSLRPLRHQKITWDHDGADASDILFHNNDTAETLLTRSLTLALDVVGFDAAESLALESFRNVVEEYMYGFLADVRRSMLSCRRTQTTAQDFLQALHTHQLSLRALLPHLRPPISPQDARIILPYEPQEKDEQYNHESLGTRLNSAVVEQRKRYVPQHFPVLPGKHTYKATAVYPVREEDPRKVRERATEEGRLGEEALRRLVSARTIDRPSSASTGQRVRSIRAQRDELWKETMQAMTSKYLSELCQDSHSMDPDDSQHGYGPPEKPGLDYGRVSSAVNADRKFWRKPAPAERSGQSGGNGVS
ncbi:MAG: hypothetical protein Q9179_004032 [Wetmoreana sp. 5 TL-2023]